MSSGRPNDGDEVSLDLLGDADPPNLVAQGEQAGGIEDRLDQLQRLRLLPVAAGDPALAGLVRVADPGPDEEDEANEVRST